ncbi:RNA-directed DNA polymerase-like protein [Gossypium australe]|uniref:RNA-directed DNA polymerase-like protein n=1 Tax=Gossypium australe TaxID=47621 RepID=A0A5B6WF37_9ROSI|nr:RNA-directed DNA polymerase-like protein [Gossypium australe]
MLDRLAGREYYCFLYGYLGYNETVVSPKDQPKITLITWPTVRPLLEECLLAYVFMDNFLAFSDSYDIYLSNLAKVLKICEETNLVLN